MPALVQDKGRAVPSFYGTVKNVGEGVKPKLPMVAVLVLAGVAVVFVLRSRSSGSSTQTGPALTLNPSNDSDVSTIDNLTQAVQALTDMAMGGGATTPTTTPVTPPVITPPPAPPPGTNVAGNILSTTGLARLFQMDKTGVLRPVVSSSGSFTFAGATVGSVASKTFAPGPASTLRYTSQFRQITAGPHKGMWVRITDQGLRFT